MATQEQLEASESLFSVQQEVRADGATCLSVVPAAVEIDDVVNAPFSLRWITKAVQFSNHEFETDLVGLTPDSATPERIPLLGGVGHEDVAGTAGYINQLEGTIPMNVRSLVSISVRWEVVGDRGVTSDSSKNSLCFNPTPLFVRLSASSPVPVEFVEVKPIVTLSSASGASHSFELPPVMIPSPVVPIPVVAVYFLNVSFTGPAFVLVPEDSPIRSASELQQVLNDLDSALRRVGTVVDIASFLLGVNSLSSALAAQPRIQFRVANEFDNFNNVTLVQRKWYQNDTEAEDELSSLVYLGPDGTGIQSWKHRNQSGGSFTLSAGVENFASLARFNDDGEFLRPPGAAVTGSVTGMNDELSSSRFV